jgi:hypothetical protein
MLGRSSAGIIVTTAMFVSITLCDAVRAVL